MTDQPEFEPKQTEAMQRLATELEKLNEHRFVKVNNSLWRLLSFQFARGLAFGLGTAIGASLLVSVIAWWLSQIEFVPILGEWATEILNSMNMPE